jgi:hypothetical protein
VPYADPAKRRAYHREYLARNKERHWERCIKNKYGIAPADYYRMLDEQDGACAICHATEDSYGRSKFCVDHDHKTGLVRGLLCTHCNRVIGLFKDSAELARSAATYLEGSSCSTYSSS